MLHWVLTCIIIYISKFQNGLNHPCNSSSFYFQSKIVEYSRDMWNCFCFFNFWFFSQKFTFWICDTLSSPIVATYPINSFLSVVVCLHKIHVFDEAFLLLAIVAMTNEKNIFFLFPWQPLLGKNSFTKSCSLSIQAILEKNWTSDI